jgi:carboxyl-terminal processing protease
MKKVHLFIGSAILLFSLSAFIFDNHQTVDPQEKNQLVLAAAMNFLQKYHYQKPIYDDAFSSKAFDQFIKRLDYNKRFFLQTDIKKLEEYRHEVDNQIEAGTLTFFEVANEILNDRRKEVRAFYGEILDKPFDFTKAESIEMDHDKREYAKSIGDLKKIWEKDLKYQTLSRLHRKIENQEKMLANADTTITPKTLEELEEEAREGVQKNMDNFFIRVDKINDKDRISVYVNSLMSVTGPHSNYYPPEDKENFDISMSGKLEGIGARLSQPGNEIKVVSIVPGSASALQGDLKVDDIITAVAQDEEEFVNVEEMRLDDAIKLIRGPKGTTVRLNVVHKNGVEEIIPIVRDVVIIEETYAKSCILQENNQKVGYIKLPKFYTDFKNRNGRTCSRDVEMELEKLKKQDIDGIILDLRNNGGGSLKDVVDMVGLFIDEGPVVQVRDRQDDLQILSDTRKGVVYDGPLVVLVNEYSASASEILAAAIQDYNRGMIIGSNSTFGKGTVQRFYDMDQSLTSNFSEYKPIGAVKLTMQKFYRINGGSTQLKGVTPDIVLPDLYTYMETGERDEDFVMLWDKINPADYNPITPNWNRSELQYKTKAAIKKNDFFQATDKMAYEFEKEQNDTEIDLSLEGYKTYQKGLKEDSDAYEELFSTIEGFTVEGLPEDLKTIESDSIKTRIAAEFMEDLAQDPYVYQSTKLIHLMLKPTHFQSDVKYEVK